MCFQFPAVKDHVSKKNPRSPHSTLLYLTKGAAILQKFANSVCWYTARGCRHLIRTQLFDLIDNFESLSEFHGKSADFSEASHGFYWLDSRNRLVPPMRLQNAIPANCSNAIFRLWSYSTIDSSSEWPAIISHRQAEPFENLFEEPPRNRRTIPSRRYPCAPESVRAMCVY